MILSLPELEASADFAALAILALIQGLTEFLPISSSGHLVLAQASMGFEEPQLVLDVALHVGTLLAIFVVYRRDLLGIARAALRGELRELGLLALATLPAAVVGLAFKDALAAAFHEPRFAAGGLLLASGVLVCRYLLGRLRPSERPTLMRMALLNAARRRARSLSVVALLATGCFLVLAVSAMHLVRVAPTVGYVGMVWISPHPRARQLPPFTVAVSYSLTGCVALVCSPYWTMVAIT